MKPRAFGWWLALWLPASAGIHAAAFAWAVHQGPAPRVSSPSDPPPASAILTGGETFDIDPERAPEDDSTTASATSERLDQDSNGATKSAPRPHAASHASAGKTGQSTTSAVAEVFGAEGDRAAVDLATAFTRAFPQIASADAGWATAPLGSSGAVDVTLEIDDGGNLIRSVSSAGGSASLRRGVERTVVLLQHRIFTAHARTTTLHVAATVSPDAVHDGLHGDVFALGGAVGSGDVFFALAIGRRVDIRITH